MMAQMPSEVAGFRKTCADIRVIDRPAAETLCRPSARGSACGVCITLVNRRSGSTQGDRSGAVLAYNDDDALEATMVLH
jgi:hypothetical protein